MTYDEMVDDITDLDCEFEQTLGDGEGQYAEVHGLQRAGHDRVTE